jgi:hypothetical protein
VKSLKLDLIIIIGKKLNDDKNKTILWL